jgi:hypothetical protein
LRGGEEIIMDGWKSRAEERGGLELHCMPVVLTVDANKCEGIARIVFMVFPVLGELLVAGPAPGKMDVVAVDGIGRVRVPEKDAFPVRTETGPFSLLRIL